ncbi:MAG: hypothetical protein DGJ47_000790 [Rickettsiaceae bacterium]
MRVFNVMLSRDLGGIQQSYVDYNDALVSNSKHDVINIVSCRAEINNALTPNHRILNLGSWCFISKLYFLILFLYYRPKVVICHGNRAIQLCIFAKLLGIKRVGVSHNYNYKSLLKCDYIITLTEDLRKHLSNKGYSLDKTFPYSNIIRIQKDYCVPNYANKNIITIGAFGRLIKGKGFHDLIAAIYLLKKQEAPIKLIIGGDGKEMENLKDQITELGLQEDVILVGWVDDKELFFQKIDIFCLPSHSEAFGIVLLEAMHHSKPIIATKIDGPQEIITDKHNGLLAESKNPNDLAEKILYLIKNPLEAQNISKIAYKDVKNKYSLETASERLSNIMRKINEL